MFVLLHLVIGALGVYVLGRTFDIRPLASWIGGLLAFTAAFWVHWSTLLDPDPLASPLLDVLDVRTVVAERDVPSPGSTGSPCRRTPSPGSTSARPGAGPLVVARADPATAEGMWAQVAPGWWPASPWRCSWGWWWRAEKPGAASTETGMRASDQVGRLW